MTSWPSIPRAACLMASDTVVLRRASVADAAAIALLSAELGYPAAASVVAERLDRLTQRADHAVWVAEASREVVGWIHVAEQDLLEYGRRAEILGLVVASLARRRSVGRQLVTSAESWARARGLDQIAVRSNAVRLESHPFYERLGYQRIKTQHVYRKPLVPSA